MSSIAALPQSTRISGAEDDVGASAVDAQADAAQTGNDGAQKLNQAVSLWDVRAGDDHDDHQLTGGGRAGHDVADEAAPGQLIVGGHVVLAHPRQHGLRGLGGILALNGASVFGQGDEIVAARGEEAAGGRAADLCDGIRALIAVAEGMLHAQNGGTSMESPPTRAKRSCTCWRLKAREAS